MDIEQVFAAIRSERAYQDEQYGALEQQKRSLYDWIGSIRYYQNKALHAELKSKTNVLALGHIRKIAALCVAAMQQYGVDPREGYSPIPTPEPPTIAEFVKRVKERAERNMESNNTVSGAHWNAMRQVLAEMGIEAEI